MLEHEKVYQSKKFLGQVVNVGSDKNFNKKHCDKISKFFLLIYKLKKTKD